MHYAEMGSTLVQSHHIMIITALLRPLLTKWYCKDSISPVYLMFNNMWQRWNYFFFKCETLHRALHLFDTHCWSSNLLFSYYNNWCYFPFSYTHIRQYPFCSLFSWCTKAFIRWVKKHPFVEICNSGHCECTAHSTDASVRNTRTMASKSCDFYLLMEK